MILHYKGTMDYSFYMAYRSLRKLTRESRKQARFIEEKIESELFYLELALDKTVDAFKEDLNVAEKLLQRK